MEKLYILRKVGNCGGCKFQNQSRDLYPCVNCERNQIKIESLSDEFVKCEVVIPEPPEEDNTKIADQNKHIAESWGMKYVDPKDKKRKKGLT